MTRRIIGILQKIGIAIAVIIIIILIIINIGNWI
jgi:hypothetical protein